MRDEKQTEQMNVDIKTYNVLRYMAISEGDL